MELSLIEIEAHPYDIFVCDEELNSNGEFQTEIRLWCLDKESKPLLVRIKDYPVSCKIELPDFNSDKNHVQWHDAYIEELIRNMKKILDKKEITCFKDWSLFEGKQLYYYNGDKKTKFILMKFNTVKDMHTISRICKKIFTTFGKIELKFWEMDVDIYNKMFSEKGLSISEKFRIKGEEIDLYDEERISKFGTEERPIREFICSYKNFEKLKPEESLWVTYPKICSWDIETYSHNPKCFPQKSHCEDCVFSISLSFQTYMQPATLKNIVILIGPCRKIPDVTVYCAKDEHELLDKFCDIIIEEDPEVLVGYNIFSFDFPYVNTRLVDVGRKWKNLGRTIEDQCYMKDISWSSSAYGKQELSYIVAPGRISIDMLPYIKRDHKLPMYKLDTVSEYFLGEKKVDLKPQEMFAIHKQFVELEDELEDLMGEEDFEEKCVECEKGKEMISLLDSNEKIIKYNVQDTVLVIKLVEKLNVWISLIEMSTIVRVTPIEIFTRGQQKRCIAQLYHASSHKGIVMTRRERDVIFFNGGYVAEPEPGFHELSFCLDFNSLYPSIMIAYNICFTTLLYNPKALKEGVNLIEITQEEPKVFSVQEDDDFDYGDYVDDGDEGDKKEKVKREYTFGFVNKDVKKGLLPEILENLLGERKKVKKMMKNISKKIESFDEGILKKVKEDKNMTFDQIKDQGVIKILKEMFPDLDMNSKIQDYIEVIEKEFNSDKVTYILYNSRQLALKVSANSLYGFLGAQKNGKFSLIEGSMSVTFKGRDLIIKSGLFFEKHFGTKTIYGDTDSVFLEIPGFNDPKKAYEIGMQMERKINGTKDQYDKDGKLVKKGEKGIFIYPLYLELEKIIKVLLMRKKHYMYMEYDQEGNIIKMKNSDLEELNSKGVPLARRDNCKLLRKTYEKIARMRFAGVAIEQIFDVIVDKVLSVIDLKFDNLDDLAIIKNMGSNYKNKTYPLAILSDIMKEIGRPIQTGERFPALVVNAYKGESLLGYKMRPKELFLEIWEKSEYKYGEFIPEDYRPIEGLFPPETIDPLYYIDNVLAKPVDRLFRFAYLDIIENYAEHKYTPKYNKRLKGVGVDTPLKMINLIIKDHKNIIKEQGIMAIYDEIENLKEWFREI